MKIDRTIVGLVTAAFMSILLTASYVGSIPPTVLTPESGQGLPRVASSLTPQGWAFFTREGREETLTPWIRDERGHWRVEPAWRSTTVDHWFGAERGARALVGDVATLSKRGLTWSECAVAVEKCLRERLDTPERSTLMSWHAKLCGPVALVKSRPIPFSYAGLTDRRETQVAVTHVQCVS